MDEQQKALLTAIAHPVRLEVYDTLQASRQPMTEREILSVTLGGRAGVRKHLQALAAVGLAQVDDQGGWSAVQTPVLVPDLLSLSPDDPDRAVVERVHKLFADRRIARLRQWSLVQRKEGWEDWRGHVVANDWTIHMTPDELGALETDLMAVVREHRARLNELPPRPDGAAVFISLFAAPLDALRPTL